MMNKVRKYIIGGTAIVGSVALQKYICSAIDRQNVAKRKKFESFYYLAERWITIYEEGKSLESILEERHIKTVAVYGLGAFGKHVVTQLKGSRINVAYVIDQAVKGHWQDVEVKPLKEEISDVDAIIVTAINDMDVIEKNLKKYTRCTVLSLEELLYEG